MLPLGLMGQFTYQPENLLSKFKTLPEITIGEDERMLIAFHLSCRAEDYEREIKAHERRGHDCYAPRLAHAKLVRTKLKLSPHSLCGPIRLMDGTTITPEDLKEFT